MTQMTDEALIRVLPSLLERVRDGEEVSITRDGKEIARLVPPVEAESEATRRAKPGYRFKSLKKFRDSMPAPVGEPLSQTVIRMRDEERF